MLGFVGSSMPLLAQGVTVRGTVLSDDDAPIPGASVQVQGADIGTLTNQQGEFMLVVPNADATLIVSRVGYTQGEVALQGRTEVIVRLSVEAVALDEIVVVGYGTQRRSDVTGSVASISAERLEDRATVSIEQSLEGVMPGVSVITPGGGAEPRTTLTVRGQNSISASNAPLIVVDGIPYEGSISELNQNDVESINVLKDASAAAIYGARGSNGVVLITTKRGGGAPRISYSGHTGVQEITNVPRLMTATEFADFKCVRLNDGDACDEVLTSTELENLNAGRSADWVDLAMRTGFQQQHALSFAGGAEGIQYYITGSLLDVSGVARNDEFDRYTARVNLSSDVKSWLRMGTNTHMSVTDRSGLSASFEDAFFMNPLTNPYNDDGTLTTTPWPEDVFWGNPLEGLIVDDSDVTRRIFTSNFVELSAPFLDGLSYRFNGGLDFAAARNGRYYGRGTRTGLDVQGEARTSDATRFDWTAENVVNFNRTVGTNQFGLTGLFSLQGNNIDNDYLNSQGFPNDVLTYYQANLGRLITPSYVVSHSRLVSQMGRLNYGYDDRYLVTLTARRDGYSGFGANNKYGVFPSLAVGWNITNEPFWRTSDIFNALKLRVSYGQNGNQAIPPYSTLARLTDQSYVDNGQTAPGFLPSTLGNPNLKWETTTSLNVGLDFGLWSDRVTGSVDAYRSRTDDLLLSRLISPVHGITRITENIGEVANRGVELQISTLNVNSPDFSWSTDFNISANRNEIIDLYGSGENDLGNQWFIGHPIDVIFDYQFDGIWQEGDNIDGSAQPGAQPGDVRIRDINGDGEISTDDRTFIGNLQPDYALGMFNTVRYKGLSLSGFVHSVQGLVRENGLLGMNLVHADVRRNTVYREYWTPDNPSNIVPRNSDESNPLGVPFLEDASFIRLRDLTLSYDLPTSLTDRFGTAGFRLYINGRNLWTHTDWSGMDPEFNATNQRGIPLERVIVGGIDVTF
jgi:TonB-linked SusC/RagA family outer membrane protein